MTMHTSYRAHRTNLVLGAALLGCTLAAARRAEAQNMLYTTVTALTLNGSGTYAASPGFVTLPGTNWTGSLNYMSYHEYTNTPITSAYVITYFNAYNSGYDSVIAYISSGFTTDWNLSGSFGVTISQSVTVGLVNGDNWLIDGLALSDGQTIGPGSYNITWAHSGSYSRYAAGLTFTAAAAAIPLPGAAGLAACGLLGLTRRRRR